MNILTRTSSIDFLEELTSAATICRCLVVLYVRNGSEVSTSLSQGFLHVWPEVWKIIESILIFSVTLPTLHAETRQFARKHIVDVCCVLGHDDQTLLQMISTPGFDSLVLDMWLMEVEDPACQPWDDDDHCSSIAAFLDRLFSSVEDQSDGKQRLEAFLAPMKGTSFASTALKHQHDAFYRARPNFDCVIWNTHIMTVISENFDPLGNALLTQHVVPATTKILVSLAAETPSLPTASLKGKVISYALWNLLSWVRSTDGVTWIIQALDAKLMFALIQCERWLPFMHGDPEDFFYPFLNEYLPSYSAYRSVLCVMSKYLSKIQKLGLDSGKSRDIPLWNAWNSFVNLVESRLDILRLRSGGVLPAYERCHSATVSHIYFTLRKTDLIK
jgi:hypothetical protein